MALGGQVRASAGLRSSLSQNPRFGTSALSYCPMFSYTQAVPSRLQPRSMTAHVPKVLPLKISDSLLGSLAFQNAGLRKPRMAFRVPTPDVPVLSFFEVRGFGKVFRSVGSKTDPVKLPGLSNPARQTMPRTYQSYLVKRVTLRQNRESHA